MLNHFSRVQLFSTPWTVACEVPLSMGFSRQECWSGCHALLQGIFLTQGSNLCLLCLLNWPLVPPGKAVRPLSVWSISWFSVQFSSVTQLCSTLCNPMNHSRPGLPVHQQFPEFTQIHIHRVSDAIQPSHPLSSPSPPAPNPSQHQSLFQ